MSPKERLTGITTVAELQEVIRAATEAMNEIQAACKHPEFECVMYSYRVGAYNPTRICKSCKRPLPGITDDEFATVLEEWNEGIDNG